MVPSILTNLVSVLTNVSQLLSKTSESLERIIKEVSSHVRTLETMHKEADKTRLFWQSVNFKLDQFKGVMGRRVILDSRYQPIHLSGRYSKHWLILFSDIIVDVGQYYSAILNSLTL